MARTMRENAVTLQNGLNAHYCEWPGDGRELILLHPSLGYGRMWEWVADALGESFHIYAPDQRGHGRSGHMDGDYSAEEYAEDLRLFMDELEIDRAIIVGHSLGGRVAQVFAAHHPERVLAMGIVAGPHISNFYPATRTTVRQILEGCYATIQYPEAYASREELFAFMRTRVPWLNDPDIALNHRIEHAYAEREDGHLVPRCDHVRVAQGLAYVTYNLRPYAAQVQCPVLIIRATLGGSSAEQFDEMARYWRYGSVADVEGHYCLEFENPVGVANVLITFLEKLS